MLSTVLGNVLASPKEAAVLEAASLPNPFTPLAFLPPDVAWEATVAIFVLVACLTVMVWDILNNLGSDYLLLTRRKFGFPTAVYFVSRLGTLCYILGTVIVNTAPIGHCRQAGFVANAFLPFAVPSSSLLLFFQARAMYMHNRYIVALFAFLWLAVFAGTIPILATTMTSSLGPTDYCVTFAAFRSFYTIPLITTVIYDTILFSATVLRVYQCSMADTDDMKATVETFVFGKHLPLLSKALLKNGQAYFLSTVAVSLLNLVVYYIDALPQSYRLIMGEPDIVLINIMACRIYRNTRLGIFELPTMRSTPTSNSAIRFAPTGIAATGRSGGDKPPGMTQRKGDPPQFTLRLSEHTSGDLGSFTISDHPSSSQTLSATSLNEVPVLDIGHGPQAV
ncbi:hypothetical protein BJ165DRAFT_1387746 [Panaeolus papilionaceus]|nr:hypothetical protein BJ165DRAFT_1387746 [Panaeolus papilionaceus]